MLKALTHISRLQRVHNINHRTVEPFSEVPIYFGCPVERCNAGFAVTLQKSLWLVRYIFTFEWAVPLKESWEIWGNADIVFALRSVSRTPVEYQAQTRHPWARMNSAYVTPVTDAAAQTHPWLVVLFSFGWLALGMKRVGVNMSGWANQRQSRVYFSVCEVSTNKVDQCTWSNTSL